MKKYIIILLLIIFLLFLVLIKDNKSDNRDGRVSNNSNPEKRAIFLSYIELKKYVKGHSEEEAKKNIDIIIDNIYDFNFNVLILQVRSFSDAIYESSIFPWSSSVSSSEGINPGYDVLKYFIEKAHEKKIELHAWINPYRIRNNTDTDSISSENKAYEWLNTNNVKVCENGIFYNPASKDVQKLVIDGVVELLNNYDVDGIHFDDYFYPSCDIDSENYEEFSKKNENISLDEYRLLMVNNMVKKVHKITKKRKKVFGISPEGNIENNYSSNYADVYEWGRSDKYVDYLMPQIYYGFYNEVKPFNDVVNEWNDLVKGSNVKIIPALAFYKTGKIDEYAKSGAREWVENDNIIMKQILISRNINNYNGFAIFRYDSMFGDNDNQTTLKEKENLKKIMKK